MDERMARRYFNWTLAIVLVVAIAVFAGAVLALHHWQKSTRAERALPRGEQAYAQENWDDAAEAFGRYLAGRKDDVPVLQKYADAQLKRRPLTGGHIDQAIGAYRSILRLNAGDTEAAKRLVELYIARSSPRDANQVASDYLQKIGDDSELRRMLAYALSEQRKYPEAAKTLMDLIRDHPDAVPAYEMLGRLALGHPNDVNTPAEEWFDKAVAANPQSAMAYIIRGEFHRASGRREKALDDFERAAKCNLSDVDVHLRLAQEMIRMQEFDKAKEHLTVLQAKASKKVSLWQSWAAVVLATGSAEERATIAESGLRELAAYPWDFMPTATELFATANQPEKAQECISRMRQKGLQPEMLTFLDGLVAVSRGNLWDAVARWRDAVAQGPKVHWYAGGLGPRVSVRMMLASTYTQLGDLQSAIAQLQTLIMEEPSNFEGRLTLARLMIRTRNLTGALEQAREVLKLIPGYADAVLLEMQARILLLSGADASTPNREQAWQQIEKQLAQLDQAMGGSVQVKLLMAQALDKQGKSAEAIKLLEDVRTKNPSDLRATLLEVQVLAGQDKLAEATALLRGAIEQFPQAVEPVQTLAILLNRQKDSAQCESVVKQAIARMQQPEARRDLGLLLASLYRLWSREDDQYQWLTDMAGQFPNDIQIKRQLLACATVAKDVQQAQTLVDQIKSLEGPAGWQWRYEQARIWVNPAIVDENVFRARYYTQTTAFLQENLLANPNDQASRLLLAAAHERAGQQQLALSAYREARSRSPDNIVIITQTVAALQKSGGAAEIEEADRILKEASARQLYHPDLEKLELQGQRMQLRDQVRRGALDSASDTLQQLIRRDPNDVSASLWLARISMQQGRLDEAEVILKELETKAPQSISVAQTRVQLHMLRGNLQEAMRLCDETVQKNDQAAAYLLRAWTYAGLREYEKAAADFAQALAKDPNEAGIWVDRARFYQSFGHRDEAIQDVRRALDLSSGNQSVLNYAIPLCLSCGSPRLIQEAEATLDKARTGDPNNPELKLLKAQFLLSRGTRLSIEQGQRLLREVTAARPQLSQAWYLLGRLELGGEQPGRALDIALSGLSHNERDRDLLLLKADAEAARSPALAVPTLRPLWEQYPNDIEIERRLAVALYGSGDKNKGRSIIEARMKAEPNNPVPPATLAALLASDGRWTDVAEQVTNWLSKHPDDGFVVSSAARSLTAQGNPEAVKVAESLLTAAVERSPKSISALSALAMLVQSRGRNAQAAAMSRKVLELDPNNIIALNNLAWILCEEDKQYQEALELADRGLKVAPNYADLLDTRGVVLYRLGQFDKAAADFAQCVELYPANARPLVSAYFHLARAYARMGRTAEAQQYLKQTMDLHERATDPAKRLSPADLAEAKVLVEELRKGR
jgi:tetratricopeptide (TPR) repeat protein